jgi:hypothetical protein
MRRFVATTEGPDQLGLREMCQRFADERWMAAHMTKKTGRTRSAINNRRFALGVADGRTKRQRKRLGR